MIYTYALEVFSEQKDSKEKMREVVQKLDKELKVCFLYFIHAGNNIFSSSCIEDELEFPCMLATNKYFLKIKKVGSFNLDGLENC